MSSELSSTGPSKEDTDEIFKRLRSLPCNKVCFDCAAKYPTWSSVTYGVFICLNCSAIHRNLGVHLSFVRSTLLDNNWTWLQIRQMQLGGNANADTFFHHHNCTSKDAKQKYSSRGAQLYRQQLSQIAGDSLKRHGTKIHIDDSSTPVKERKAEEDFFTEHTSIEGCQDVTAREEVGVADKPVVPQTVQVQADGERERKSIIGHRSSQSKQGLGGRSKGLGASKVKTNFADIEKQAELSDKLKVQEKKVSDVSVKECTDMEEASVRLAYEDLSLKQSQEVKKMHSVDPVKAKQVERLGMGFNNKNGVSHSATGDMKKIEQENPDDCEKSYIAPNKPKDLFEELGLISPHVSSFYMYKSSNDRGLSLFLNECQSPNNSSSKWAKETEAKPVISSESKPTSISKSYSTDVATTDEAQKKFGSAKSISSHQFFSDSNDSWNEKSNISKFEGSTSISSAEYFGRNETGNSSSFSVPSGPDFEDVKESVKQGVTKVAGKISSLANGVMSSLQEKYGY